MCCEMLCAACLPGSELHPKCITGFIETLFRHFELYLKDKLSRTCHWTEGGEGGSVPYEPVASPWILLCSSWRYILCAAPGTLIL